VIEVVEEGWVLLGLSRGVKGEWGCWIRCNGGLKSRLRVKKILIEVMSRSFV